MTSTAMSTDATTTADDSSSPMPSLYLAHGLPSYALPGYPEQNGLRDASKYVKMLQRIPSQLPGRPKAILCMSGHYETPGQGVKVTTSKAPKTIHEFYGFPQELYDVDYPAPGNPELVAMVQALVPEVTGDAAWGIDHGAWTLLTHLFPHADVPVVELSVDGDQPAAYYVDLGRRLRHLRQQGVVIMGSGSIVHNLRQLRWGGPPHKWAAEFNAWVADRVLQREDSLLPEYRSAPGGAMSVPEPSHYYPFLFALGAAYDEDERRQLIDWIDNGANGMTSFGFGLSSGVAAA